MYLDLCFPRMGKTSYSCGNNSGVSVCSKSTIQGADMAVSDTRYLFFDHLMLSVVGEASEGLEICRGEVCRKLRKSVLQSIVSCSEDIPQYRNNNNIKKSQ